MEPESCFFGSYSDDEINKISVKNISLPDSFDVFNQPVLNGIYDTALGPFDNKGVCSTCGKMLSICSGHFGKIEFCSALYHPLFFRLLFRLLKMKCFYCHRFRCGDYVTSIYLAKFRLLHARLLKEFFSLCSLSSSKGIQRSRKSKGNNEVVEQNESDDELEQEAFPDEDEKKSDNFSSSIQELCALASILPSELKTLQREAIEPKSSEMIREIQQNLTRDFLRNTSVRKCLHCQSVSPALKQHKYSRIFQLELPSKTKELMETKSHEVPSLDSSILDPSGKFSTNEISGQSGGTNMRILLPNEVEKHLHLLWINEKDLLNMVFTPIESHTSLDWQSFFLHSLLVTPNKFRPPTPMGDSLLAHPTSFYYSKIITIHNNLVTNFQQYHTDSSVQLQSRVFSLFVELQTWINSLVDSTKSLHSNKTAPSGIRQILDKKTGLFRSNIMGKRVNYAARSVISPDPFIFVNQIGIPDSFARVLTFPENVTLFNLEKLKKLVISGPFEYPGANFVTDEKGRLISLAKTNREQRIALAKTLITSTSLNSQTKKVFRHLEDGDILLANRQPSLHRPSILSLRARILHGEQTIRMHYCNCKSFNADFDGDELNIHLPQSQNARSEAYFIADANDQYFGPADGSPLRGLIQDHICAGVLLSRRDSFFSKQLVQKFLWNSCFYCECDILLETPAIIKPIALWTGKQIISMIIKIHTGNKTSLFLKSNSKVPGNAWFLKGSIPNRRKTVTSELPEENIVLFRNGNLLCGTLDKNQFGASNYGLIHALYELYGSKVAGSTLSSLSRLFSCYFQLFGFTCGVQDMVLTRAVEFERKKNIEKSEQDGFLGVAKFVGVSDVDFLSSETENLFLVKESLRRHFHQLSASEREFSSIRLDNTVKGIVESIRSSITEKALPFGQIKGFPSNSIALMTIAGAKGSVVNFSQISCLLGQQELEGRRVPLMQTGKTLPCFSSFDPSPRAGGFITDRFISAIRPQQFFFHCMAGREGLIDTAVKTANAGYLQRCLIKHLESIRVHYDNTVRDCDGSLIQFLYGDDALDVSKIKFLNKLAFYAMNYSTFLSRFPLHELSSKINSDQVKKWWKHFALNPNIDPILSKFSPSHFLGSVSEKFQKQLETYIKDAPHDFPSEKDRNKFMALMWLRYHRSLVEPGESVGILAAQSIGEPSTQMTLNTFHLAGHGGTNVTLGIPRMREVIMSASDHIETPFMECPMRISSQENAKMLNMYFKRTCLAEVLDKITINESTTSQKASEPTRSHTLKFHLIELRESFFSYENIFEVVSSELLPALKHKISRALRTSILQSSWILHSKFSTSEKPKNTEIEPASDEENQVGDDFPKDESDISDEEGISADSLQDADATEKAQFLKKSEQFTYEENTNQSVTDEKDRDFDDFSQKIIKQKFKSVRNSSKSFFVNISKDPLHKFIEIHLSFPIESSKFLLSAIVESLTYSTVLHSIPNITQSFILDNEKDNSQIIQTSGVNFVAAWKYSDLIDVDKIHSNDIVAILHTYGVEAARNVIVQQINTTFSTFGISVDYRHLSLIADYMTHNGLIRPLNRSSMSHKTSPFQQMSFETTTNFLTEACEYGYFDDIHSPSSKIAVGSIPECGTGSFSLLHSI